MILVVDIGNTNIFVGVYEEGKLMTTYRTETDMHRSSDDYAILLQSFFVSKNWNVKITGSIVSSVVPSLTQVFLQAIQKLFAITPLLVGNKIKSGLSIHMEHANEVGADLISVSVGAKEKYGYPALIVDLGTATKIMLVDKNGAFSGGIVMPGLKVSIAALVGNTAQLPEISLICPSKVIGKNTPDAMNAGTIYGHIDAIEGLCHRMEKELGYPCKRILTGGYAPIVRDKLDEQFIYDENLILDGLFILYQKNGDTLK